MSFVIDEALTRADFRIDNMGILFGTSFYFDNELLFLW